MLRHAVNIKHLLVLSVTVTVFAAASRSVCCRQCKKVVELMHDTVKRYYSDAPTLTKAREWEFAMRPFGMVRRGSGSSRHQDEVIVQPLTFWKRATCCLPHICLLPNPFLLSHASPQRPSPSPTTIAPTRPRKGFAGAPRL